MTPLIEVKIGTVDIENSAHGRVQLTLPDRRTQWHHFRSRRAWSSFHALWRELEPPCRARFNPRTGRFYARRSGEK